VQWEASKTYAKATFKLNDQVMFAYYTPDGDMLAITRNIVSTQLPINLLADIKKNYSATGSQIFLKCLQTMQLHIM